MQELSLRDKHRNLLDGIDEALKQARHDYLRSLRVSFWEQSQELFTDHKELHSISWDQASFDVNDYEFFVNRIEVNVNGLDAESVPNNHKLYPAYKDVAEFMELYDDEDFKSLFGDFAHVVITREGIDVSFYDPK